MAGVFLLQFGRVALVDDQTIVVEQLLAGLELALGLDEDAPLARPAVDFIGDAVGLARMVDPSRGVAAPAAVDDMAAVVRLK
jgi:hypothetical protein